MLGDVTVDVSLEGQVAVVSGAARGLGRAHAVELARLGAAVVVDDLPDAAGLDELVAEIEAAGGSALAVRATVATRDGAETIVASALERFGRIDALVNNAGILRNGYFSDLTDAQIDEILAVHLRGAFHLTQPVYRHMSERGSGRIVFTSSSSAFGMLGLSNYAAAKAGLVGLTRALALESAELGHGVRVNAVMPNARTRIGENDPLPGFAEDTRYMRAYAAIGERMEPEYNAPLVAYLASPACAVNGEVFSALGGRYARVVLGLTPGWLDRSATPATPQQVADHLDEIMGGDTPGLVPKWNREEYEQVAAALADG